MNLRQWIGYCAERMEQAGLCFGHGTDNAWDEAAWLVTAALGLDPLIPLDADQAVGDAQLPSIKSLLAARISTRRPLAYLLGEAWFCGLSFEVNDTVLVPRSPIGELILSGFSPWLAPGSVHSALDLCTGSGALAVAMAYHLPELRVTASDISEPALEVARRNAARHGVAGRVVLRASDLFESLDGSRWDLIVSNPPYVPSTRLPGLPPEYRAEPELALLSPGEGLAIPVRILEQAVRHLTGNGILVCEVGESADRLQALLPAVPLTWIEFEHGGEGVFTIDRETLWKYREPIGVLARQLSHVA